MDTISSAVSPLGVAQGSVDIARETATRFLSTRMGIAWALVGVIAITDLVWLLSSDFGFQQSTLGATFVMFVACGASRFFLKTGSLLTLADGWLLLAWAWPALRVFNHLTFSTSGMWFDGTLASFDGALGLSWIAYAGWLNDHPGILRLLDLTYGSLTHFSVAGFVAVAIFGRKQSAQEFLLLFVSVAVVVSLVGIFMPAYGPAIHFQGAVAEMQYIGDLGRVHLPFYDALRSGMPSVLVLERLPGLTTFPSFHTAMAIILVYSARDRLALFIPCLVFSSLMLAGTPIFGSHYFVDIAAGAAVTGLAIAAVRALPERILVPARESGYRQGENREP